MKLSLYACARNPTYFKDATSFNPERFDITEKKYLKKIIYFFKINKLFSKFKKYRELYLYAILSWTQKLYWTKFCHCKFFFVIFKKFRFYN